MITRAQVRAARAALRWDMKRLAAEAGVSMNTVYRFESGKPMLSSNLAKVQAALEAAGVEFINSGKPGIRWPANLE